MSGIPQALVGPRAELNGIANQPDVFFQGYRLFYGPPPLTASGGTLFSLALPPGDYDVSGGYFAQSPEYGAFGMYEWPVSLSQLMRFTMEVSYTGTTEPIDPSGAYWEGMDQIVLLRTSVAMQRMRACSSIDFSIGISYNFIWQMNDGHIPGYPPIIGGILNARRMPIAVR